MNYPRLLVRYAAPALLLFLGLSAAVGCTKEDPTTVLIYVTDTDNKPVVGATVKLFADPTVPVSDPTRLDREAVTDEKGEATFDYSDQYEQGQAGFAVLDILVTKDTLEGDGIIKIVEEEDNRETVIVE
jgi:hypothetical protein